MNCRERHLKCSGGLICVRCAKEAIPFIYEPSHRGQRRAAVLPVDLASHPSSPTTCSSCRERHLKCTGGPPFARRAKEGLPCLFNQSFLGQSKQKLPEKLVWARPRGLPYSTSHQSSFSSYEAFLDPIGATRLHVFSRKDLTRTICSARQSALKHADTPDQPIDRAAGLVESGHSYALVLSDGMLRALKDASNGVLVMDTSPISGCMAEISESLLGF